MLRKDIPCHPLFYQVVQYQQKKKGFLFIGNEAAEREKKIVKCLKRKDVFHYISP